jgi:hypothetical protein
MRRSYALAVALTVALAIGGCGGTTKTVTTTAVPVAPVAPTALELKGKAALEAEKKHTENVEAHKQAREKRAEKAKQAHEAAAQRATEAQEHAESHRTVPNETHVRLDVAEEELESSQLAYKVVGGGTFGVVVKSDWTVCEMKPSPGTHVEPGSTVRLIIARTCE